MSTEGLGPFILLLWQAVYGDFSGREGEGEGGMFTNKTTDVRVI